jgi:RsiW-degrading membrane proteinase PrsW (M82 family)
LLLDVRLALAESGGAVYAALVLLVSIAPAVAFLAWILHMDRREPEPLGYVLAVVGLGAASCIPAVIVELALEGVPVPSLPGIAAVAFDSFVRVAPIEELCKLGVVLLFVWRNSNFNEENDGIVYVGASAMGFALLENVIYVADGGLGVGVLRAFSAIPLHSVTGIALGYHVGLARFAVDPARTRRLVIRGFVIAYLLHGVYDTLVGSGSALALLVLPLIACLFVIGVTFLKRGRRLSEARWKQATDAAPPAGAAAPRPRGRHRWMAVAGRLLFGVCGLFWILLLLGLLGPEADPESASALLGGVILTFLPACLGVLLEVGYQRRRLASRRGSREPPASPPPP